MPNYIAKTKNNVINLGFFVCDMEADDFASNTLHIKDKYNIIEIVDPVGHIKDQAVQQNKEGLFF
jgi:hypothetical protein